MRRMVGCKGVWGTHSKFYQEWLISQSANCDSSHSFASFKGVV
jgi:hypothetical protein